MIKTKGLIMLLLIMISILSLDAQSTLKIEINNLKNSLGYIQLSLVDENNIELRGIKSKVNNGSCTIIFKDLKNMSYAIQYFHDENANNILDKNFIGIPKEGCGFSNDAFGKFGPKNLANGFSSLRVTWKLK